MGDGFGGLVRRYFFLAVMACLFGIVLSPFALAQELLPQCGEQSDGTSLIGSMTFLDGKVNIDFKTDSEKQSVVTIFEFTTCRADNETLSGVPLPAGGGKELPEEAISFGPSFLNRGTNQVVMKVTVDPTKLKAGTYAAAWSIGGETTSATSIKSLITRSHSAPAMPLFVTVLGAVAGFVSAIFAAWTVAGKKGQLRGFALGWQNGAAFVAGLVLAALATYQFFATTYLEALVWEDTHTNYLTLLTGAFAVAAGGAVTGQLTKAFASSTTD